jgi:hypothetical protein
VDTTMPRDTGAVSGNDLFCRRHVAVLLSYRLVKTIRDVLEVSYTFSLSLEHLSLRQCLADS